MEKPMITRKAAESFLGSPLMSSLGMQLEGLEARVAVVSMPFDPAWIGDPEKKTLHGGVVSTLLDSTCGLAVFAHPECATITATINLRIDYMRPAQSEKQIFARAEVYHVTRTVAFVRGRAWEDDPDQPFAMAAAAFTFAKKNSAS